MSTLAPVCAFVPWVMTRQCFSSLRLCSCVKACVINALYQTSFRLVKANVLFNVYLNKKLLQLSKLKLILTGSIICTIFFIDVALLM